MFHTLPFFLKGALVTLSMTGLATVLGMVIGILVAVGVIQGGPLLSRIAQAYINVTRGIPLLVQIFIVYFGLNTITEVRPFTAGVLALGICTAGYLAEAIRSGIMSVDPGQFEAAKALGLSYIEMMQKVVLPQALRNALPAMGNEFITLLKASSLASAISVVELTRTAYQLKQGTFKPIEMYLNAAILYLIMTMVFTYLMGRMEKSWGEPRRVTV